jgi:RAB protein geranylgeranyltransferase component A
MILNNINSGIAFPLVNKILEKTILSLKPGNRIYFFLSNFQDKDNIISGEAITIKNYKIQNDGNFLSDVLSVKILNNGSYIDDNLVVLTKMISNHIDSYILPFFNQIKDLQQMNDEIINKIPQNEIGKYLNGMLMCYKKQIIMKLCNNPNYEKYTNWLLELNKDDYENGKERFDGEYEFHMTLIDYLGNMNY